MKTKEKPANFDSVKFMRKRRDELGELYASNPEKFWKQLEEIRKKYKSKFHQKKKPAA